jgi:HD-GYP domain-containing protein (c-di-GMP phosphodiesterase class II)
VAEQQRNGKDTGRAALVRAIDWKRDVLAERIAAQCGTSSMLVRSMLTALGETLQSLDVAPMVSWSRMAAGIYPPRVVRAASEIACKQTLAITERLCGEGYDLDLASLIVFFEIVLRDIEASLRLRPEEPAGTLADRHSDTIETMLVMLRARDEATCTHSRVTGVWCRRIVDALGLDPITADRTVIGGVLHDIGKIATPDAVLFKPGPLDEPEWAIMREHALHGADVLMEIPTLAPYAPIVRAHHERIDGRGYPYGLAGDEIPLEARIVAVADAFHAMTSCRPYRDALTVGETVEVLRAGRGKQWESSIVDVMTAIALELRALLSDADLDTSLGGPLLGINQSLAM